MYSGDALCPQLPRGLLMWMFFIRKRSPDVLNGPLSHLKGQKNVLVLSAKTILFFFKHVLLNDPF